MRKAGWASGILLTLSVTVCYGADITQEKMSTCKAFSQMSGSIMKARQAGVDMSAMMEAKQSDEEATKIAHQVIIEAYGSPRWSTNQNREKAIADFANDKYLSCIKAS